MYNLMKNVIEKGNYELTNLLEKINKQWVEDKLNDDERNELVGLAQGNANYKNSLDIYAKLADIDNRLKVVEEKLTNINVGDKEDETTTTYEEYVAGKWYYNGDCVAVEDGNYKCIAPNGVVCVWSPTEYPAYWEKID